MVNHTLLIGLTIVFLIPGCDLAIKPEPDLLTMDYEELNQIRESISFKSPEYEIAYQRLIKEAENSLDLQVYSVTNKKAAPPSGDKHDYMSQAPFWWPDPSTPDGLPYIRKDGQRNPESQEGMFDKNRMNLMAENVMSLTLAWFFSGEEKFSSKASDLIETWFINPETCVNPNMNYAQSIPGITEGRGIGIIDTRKYVEIIDAVKLLERSKSWNKKKTIKLQNWFSDYLHWLLNSEHGMSEQARENNHGTWYDVQVSYYALFVGHEELAKEMLQKSVSQRTKLQIDLLGKQPYELSRTRSFSYSVFNLEALILLGKMGEMTGLGPWSDDPVSKRKIRLASDFLLKYITHFEDWPYKQITPVEWDRLLTVVTDASKLLDISEYASYIQYLEENLKSNNRVIITKMLINEEN